MVGALGYDEVREILEVEFNSGSIYQYEGVSKSEYLDLIDSASIGSFMNSHIIGVYSEHRVR